MSHTPTESTQINVEPLITKINENFIKLLKKELIIQLEVSERCHNQPIVELFCKYFIENFNPYKILLNNACHILKKSHINSENSIDLSLRLLCKYFSRFMSELFICFLNFRQIISEHCPHIIDYTNIISILDGLEVNQYTFFDTTHTIYSDRSLEEITIHFQSIISKYEEDIVIDQCEEFDSSRRIRRLDSLAKLLNLSSSYSVCSAVSIVKNQLIIACNINRNTHSSEVLEHTYNKFIIIQTALNQLLAEEFSVKITKDNLELDATNLLVEGFAENATLTDLLKYFNDEYIDIVLEFLRQLINAGGRFQSETVLFQAFNKLYLSMCLNKIRLYEGQYFFDNDLSSKDIETLLTTTPLILIPEYNNTNHKLGLQSYNGMEKSLFIDFPESSQQFNIHSFHAEQLIGYYIKNKMAEVLSPRRKIPIGISKAACLDCMAALHKETFFSIRATSNQSFENTAGLFSKQENLSSKNNEELSLLNKRSHPDQITQSNKRISLLEAPKTPEFLIHRQSKISITYLKASPMFSPEQLKTATESSGSVAKLIGSCLLDKLYDEEALSKHSASKNKTTPDNNLCLMDEFTKEKNAYSNL